VVLLLPLLEVGPLSLPVVDLVPPEDVEEEEGTKEMGSRVNPIGNAWPDEEEIGVL